MSEKFPLLSSMMLNEFGNGAGTWRCTYGIFVYTLEMGRAGTETGWSGAGKLGNTVWTGGSDFGTIALGGNFFNRRFKNF